MNLGRNDPCHCGSGKKYKKCCLGKDASTAHAESATEAAPATTSEAALPQKHSQPGRSKALDPWNIRWNEFEAADYQGKFDGQEDQAAVLVLIRTWVFSAPGCSPLQLLIRGFLGTWILCKHGGIG
jgi:hypothetical protein